MDEKAAKLRAGMTAIWTKSLPHVREQLTTIEDAVAGLLDGSITPEQQRAAEREAHRLAGSAGSFGFHEASRAARELEHMLEEGGSVDVRRASELVLAMRAQLDTEELPGAAVKQAGDGEEERVRVLVVDDDIVLSEAIVHALNERKLRAGAAATLAEARAAIDKDAPDAILLDIVLDNENGLDLLDELNERNSSIPVLVLTARDEFADRVGAARKGARAFLQKPMQAAEIASYAAEFIHNVASGKPHILAVDDDASILDLLRTLLLRADFSVTVLDDPRRFWDVLNEARPDLLLLDYEMPYVNGIELCRVVRTDPQWRTLPLVFLTARTDADTVTAAFNAGADDFIGKPIVNAEVIARVRNRLERQRLLRELSETDYLTGLANRAKSAQMLASYQKLCERYNQPLSLAVIDLDRFTSVNETHGHATGDEVLRAFGALLRNTFRGEDVVARWEGQSFAVGMYGMARSDAVHRLGELLDAMNERGITTARGERVMLSFSAGVAQYGVNGIDGSAVAEAATAAMRAAKAQGAGRIFGAGGFNAQNVVDVLVVEDDESIAELLLHALETRGYSVKRLSDGQAAIETVAGSSSFLHPRVVLLDVDLPGIDGISVLRKWRQAGALENMRVIMLTVRSGEPEMVETLKLDAFDHIAKPFSISVLMQRVRRALET